ncbi:SEC-C metal-binding domain-containing protein [Lujinxingia vulgaris]|nr:SEC-C metal-binding domain-containing protein [Lujinxingia vulgaris]
MNHAGHQVHFLERLERVDGEEQELALKLYYDASFVRAYLEGTRIPPEYERVALALSDEPHGPHVVVTRSGTFVTCLGAGMEPRGLYVLERARTVGLHGYLEQMREAYDKVVSSDLVPKRVFRTAHQACHCLSREAFEEFRLVSALCSEELYPSLAQCSGKVARGFQKLALGLGSKARRIRKMSPALEKRLRGYWEDLFFLSHLTVVHAANAADLEMVYRETQRAEEMVEINLFLLYGEMLFGVSLRALWCAAAYADVIAPRLMDALRWEDVGKKGYYAMAMTVIALRHPEYHQGLVALLRSWDSAAGNTEAMLSEGQTVELILSKLLLPVLESPEEAREEHVRRARFQYEEAWKDKAVQGTRRAPETLSDAEAIAVYHMMLFDREGGHTTVYHLAQALPFLAQASAADLYPPAELLNHEPSWAPFVGLAWLEHLGMRLSTRAPVKVKATPGRNDACPCESGRKYKQCCARVALS